MQTTESAFSNLINALLLEVGAVRVSADQPFRLTSGRLSPVYFDCRQLISDPAAMSIIGGMYQWLLSHYSIPFDAIAGGESAGIPFADRLSSLTGKPMVYVRKQPHEHGTSSMIEGKVAAGARSLLVEDMITDGASKLVFVEGLRSAGARVDCCFVVLDREQGGYAVLERAGVRLWRLTTAKSVLDYALQSGMVPPVDYESAISYMERPSEWHPRT